MKYEVEWYGPMECDEAGNADPDTAECFAQDFETHAEAVKFAESICKTNAHGEAKILIFTEEPYERGFPGTYREYHGEPEVVTNED